MLVAIVARNLLLHLHGTPHGPVDAVEDDEQGIDPGLNDPATMLPDRRVYQVLPESPEPFQRSRIIQPNEAAIPNHVGIDDSNQLPPVLRYYRSGLMRWLPAIGSVSLPLPLLATGYHMPPPLGESAGGVDNRVCSVFGDSSRRRPLGPSTPSGAMICSVFPPLNMMTEGLRSWRCLLGLQDTPGPQ